jgi:hypothetical protein
MNSPESRMKRFTNHTFIPLARLLYELAFVGLFPGEVPIAQFNHFASKICHNYLKSGRGSRTKAGERLLLQNTDLLFFRVQVIF